MKHDSRKLVPLIEVLIFVNHVSFKCLKCNSLFLRKLVPLKGIRMLRSFQIQLLYNLWWWLWSEAEEFWKSKSHLSVVNALQHNYILSKPTSYFNIIHLFKSFLCFSSSHQFLYMPAESKSFSLWLLNPSIYFK